MGYIIVTAVVAFFAGAVAGYATAALKKQSEIDRQIGEFVESDGSCEYDNNNDEEPQLKSAQVSGGKFEIGDIVMEGYAIENPFAQDICMLVANKQRNDKGVMHYEYMYCNRKGNTTGMSKHNGILSGQCLREEWRSFGLTAKRICRQCR